MRRQLLALVTAEAFFLSLLLTLVPISAMSSQAPHDPPTAATADAHHERELRAAVAAGTATKTPTKP